MAWLGEQLARPAELRLIVSSVQVLAEGQEWERWGNLPLERDRLIGLIGSTGANGVVFLSGDRHAGALYRRTEGVAYPLHEITSSGMNMLRPDRPEPGPLRLGELYGRENFGTIDIDWRAEKVTLSVRSMNGEPIRAAAVRSSRSRSDSSIDTAGTRPRPAIAPPPRTIQWLNIINLSIRTLEFAHDQASRCGPREGRPAP
jgi:alkaline phosphatase D